jgi:hypothetical protein
MTAGDIIRGGYGIRNAIKLAAVFIEYSPEIDYN